MVFEFSFEDRTIYVFCARNNKIVFNFEKEFIKYFKCVACGDKVEDEDQKLKLCDEHYQDYLENFKEEIEDGSL